MMRFFSRFRTNSRSSRQGDVDPDEVLLDAYNLPLFDTWQMEGRLELPIARSSLVGIVVLFVFVCGVYVLRLVHLQVVKGAELAAQSVENTLTERIVFAERGVIDDRNGIALVRNHVISGEPFSTRAVLAPLGLAHVLGYVNYPQRDANGFYFRTESEGISGVEKSYNALLSGSNGIQIVETDARGGIRSQHVVERPVSGAPLILSVDSRVQSALYSFIEKRAKESGFVGGASVLMDIHSGELIALVSYPEYDVNLFAHAGNTEDALRAAERAPGAPFLNRALSGLYTPGSIIKPLMALAALETGTISPDTEIFSSGSLTVPNPYAPGSPSVFRDWRAHGWVDMRRALAVSSNVYFFVIGGGHDGQAGMGIGAIERYARMFGLGSTSGIALHGEALGTIPTPEWKKDVFGDDVWRLGDTYNTVIGQYGFQVTPLQAVRMIAAIAADGVLVKPVVRKGEGSEQIRLPVSPDNIAIVREGMRMAVSEGTAGALRFPWLSIAAKTGTAEVGAKKEFVNSFVVGFFPADNPSYAFATVMERGPAGVLQGAPYVMYEFFAWLHDHAPEYVTVPDSAE